MNPTMTQAMLDGGWELFSRNILMGGLAFIEKGTNKLFVPLLEDVWYHEETGRWQRVYQNEHFWVNAKRMSDRFVQTTATWSVIFQFNPRTLIFEG